MKLYFRNSNGTERFLSECENEREAFKKISDFCHERGYKMPYVRSWKEDGVTTFDVGSHTEFFLLKEESD